MVQFRRSKKVGPFRFTVSQRGLSSSIGGGPFRVGLGADRKIRRTIRIPRTGIYDTKVIGGTRRRRRSARHPILALLLCLFLLGVVIAYWKVILTITMVIAIAGGGYLLVRRNRAQRAAAAHQKPSIAARADQQNELFLQGDARGFYGEYPPAQPRRPDAGEGLASSMSEEPERVSRVGEPRLWRDHPECDEVMIQVDIWPTVPDPRWWGCFAQVATERHIKVDLGSVARGGIATPTENTDAVPSAVAAIDSAIDCANHLFVRTIARDEVEKYVKDRQAAELAEAQAKLDMLGLGDTD
jgi:hypothetical protein